MPIKFLLTKLKNKKVVNTTTVAPIPLGIGQRPQ
jgi:hypothetical protein